MVGGDVGEVFWMLDVRLRECLDLLVRGSMGHRIQVVRLWRLRLIVTRLKEREENCIGKGLKIVLRMNCMRHEANHIPSSRQIGLS